MSVVSRFYDVLRIRIVAAAVFARARSLSGLMVFKLMRSSLLGIGQLNGSLAVAAAIVSS